MPVQVHADVPSDMLEELATSQSRGDRLTECSEYVRNMM